MRITADFRAVRTTEWHEYALRFIFGGLITVLAGLIAKALGPVIGGLFLAFPAILPASITLVEKHTRRRQRRRGASGTRSGRRAAALDAAGASIGGLGLFIFALSAWAMLPRTSAWLALTLATLAWAALAIVIWKRCRG